MTTSRARILSEVLAHLEAERFQPVKPETSRPSGRFAPITPDEAARNLAALEDAISDDPTVAAWVEKEAAA